MVLLGSQKSHKLLTSSCQTTHLTTKVFLESIKDPAHSVSTVKLEQVHCQELITAPAQYKRQPEAVERQNGTGLEILYGLSHRHTATVVGKVSVYGLHKVTCEQLLVFSSGTSLSIGIC